MTVIVMTDIFTKEKRREIMASIKGSNTKPEIIVRSLIHRMGFRFSLRRKDLPGKPDIVLPRYKKVIFVHGCFWHGHHRCKRATIPKTNTDFWQNKIHKNTARDRLVKKQLRQLGWQILVAWQCELKKPNRLTKKLEKFLVKDTKK